MYLPPPPNSLTSYTLVSVALTIGLAIFLVLFKIPGNRSGIVVLRDRVQIPGGPLGGTDKEGADRLLAAFYDTVTVGQEIATSLGVPQLRTLRATQSYSQVLDSLSQLAVPAFTVLPDSTESRLMSFEPEIVTNYRECSVSFQRLAAIQSSNELQMTIDAMVTNRSLIESFMSTENARIDILDTISDLQTKATLRIAALYNSGYNSRQEMEAQQLTAIRFRDNQMQFILSQSQTKIQLTSQLITLQRDSLNHMRAMQASIQSYREAVYRFSSSLKEAYMRHVYTAPTESVVIPLPIDISRDVLKKTPEYILIPIEPSYTTNATLTIESALPLDDLAGSLVMIEFDGYPRSEYGQVHATITTTPQYIYYVPATGNTRDYGLVIQRPMVTTTGDTIPYVQGLSGFGTLKSDPVSLLAEYTN